MTEFGDDSRNNFSILMLANQHVRARPPVADRDHELLGMPEGQNNVASAPIERVDFFVAVRLRTHGRRDAPNQRCADWRQQ